MKYCQIFSGQGSLLELRDSLFCCWQPGYVGESDAHPTLLTWCSAPFAAHLLSLEEDLSLWITVENGDFDKVEEADIKQTQEFSVLCSSFFGLVFFGVFYCFFGWLVGLFGLFFCFLGVLWFVVFFARESEGWGATAILWTRFFARIVFHLDSKFEQGFRGSVSIAPWLQTNKDCSV